MFRASLLRLTRVPVSRCFSTVTRVALPQITKTTLSFVKPTGLQITRFYSHGPELTKDIIKERVIELLEGFDKIEDKSKITPEAHFSKDLNLDSLDVVEVVMALEEEFSISVNDEQSDSIKSVQQAIDFIAAQPDAV